MVDGFSQRYGDLLAGSYDCVDRIVLNAYYPLGHNPGGLRVWWRRWHGDSDEELDNTHLMRRAGGVPDPGREGAGDGVGGPPRRTRRCDRQHRQEERLRQPLLVSHHGPGL